MGLLNKILKTAGSLVPDSVVAKSAREYFNRNYSSIGVMTGLQIDSTNRRASATLELKGETQPIQVTVERYELSVSEGKTFIELKEVTASREWLTALARQALIGRKIKLPESIHGLL